MQWRLKNDLAITTHGYERTRILLRAATSAEQSST
jgi:hypothetical protein